MQQREHDTHEYRENKAQADVVVDKLRYQQTAEQRAEKTEAHRDRQREFFAGASHAIDLGSGDCSAVDHQVRQPAQHDRRVDIRQGGRKRDRSSHGGRCLYSEKLEQRSDEDVDSGGEYIRSQECVPVGAAGLCEVVEESDELLEDNLELTGYNLESGNHENAYSRRRDQQHAAYDQR